MDNQNKVSSVSVVKNKLRGQEAASLYIPPPLRVKAKSTPASKESVPPPRTSMRDMLLKELGVENSSNKSKKCENSYMLFDIDGPKSSASASNTARRAPSKTMGVGHQNGDHRASEPLSQKSSQQRIKKCDNSYLLFSGKSDDDECSGGAYSKKCIKGSKPSPRLQDSQRKATSTHYVPSLDQAEVGDSTKSPEFKKGPLVDELSCQLGISKISSPPGLLVDRPKELSDLILNKSCQSSQKKCDNSILLFDEDNASSSSLVKHTSKTENETAKYSSLSNGTVEDGQDGLSQTPSRKRPPSNEISQEGEVGENAKEGPKISNIEEPSKSLTPKTTDNISTFDTFESIEDYVVEFYDFPTALKTQDFMTFFSCYIQEGFYIKWVDETHALGVFSNPFSVTEVLKKSYELLKVRLLSEALDKSQEIASNIPIPCASRPRTCPSLARRLVSGALGLKVAVPDSVRQAEKKMLQDAKAERRLAAKQREEAWEGTLRSSLGPA